MNTEKQRTEYEISNILITNVFIIINIMSVNVII